VKRIVGHAELAPRYGRHQLKTHVRRTEEMAALAVIGGLVGGAVILATIRSKRNAKKPSDLQTMRLK
jgi:hypothetical protein